MNKAINDTYSQIVEVLNNSQLPIGVGMLILKDIYNDLNNLFKDAVQKEGPAEERVMTTDDFEKVELNNEEAVEG
jgi:hypothetical protein